MSTATMPSPIALHTSHRMSIGRVLHSYLIEVKCETLNSLRTVGASVPFLLIPVAVYVLFGVVMNPGDAVDGELGPGVVNFIFTGFATFAVLMPGIFGGVNVAIEREGGLLKLRRALPMPTGASLLAKMVTSMIFAAAALSAVVIAALLAGQITLTAAQLLIIWAVMILGSIPFCAIGLFIGSIASASAAPAFGNLVFLPMMWLSGIFIPLREVLQPWSVIWPAFHLRQLALGLAGMNDFGFFPTSMAAGALVGVTVLFGGLAVRRLARTG